MARKRGKWVYAKEPIVVTVGARPVKYKRANVYDRRRDERVEVDLHMAPPDDPGELGTPYAFKAGQKVLADHPAVKECPDAFTEESEELEPVA